MHATIWHNPNCGTSRKTLAILEATPGIQLTVIEQGDDYQIVGGMVDAKNFNLVVHGTFDLSTIVLEGTQTGRI